VKELSGREETTLAMLIIMDHCSIDVHGPHLADEAAESAITLRLGSGRVKHQKTRSPGGTAEIDFSARGAP
jgi:hypothetical protein